MRTDFREVIEIDDIIELEALYDSRTDYEKFRIMQDINTLAQDMAGEPIEPYKYFNDALFDLPMEDLILIIIDHMPSLCIYEWKTMENGEPRFYIYIINDGKYYELYDDDETFALFKIVGKQPRDFQELKEEYIKTDPGWNDNGFLSFLEEKGYNVCGISPSGVYF